MDGNRYAALFDTRTTRSGFGLAHVVVLLLRSGQDCWRIWLSTLWNLIQTKPDLTIVVIVGFSIFIAKIVLRVIIKMQAIKSKDKAIKRSAQFDCLRFGPDLVILSTTSDLSLFRYASKQLSGTAYVELMNIAVCFVVLQLLLLLSAIALTMFFDSAEHNYWSGILTPSACGIASIYIAVAVVQIVTA